MATAAKQFYTPEQYLSMERAAEYKSEYFSGEIVARSGASARHSRICVNLTVLIDRQIRSRNCEIHTSDLRVNVGATYMYPDLSVVCGKVELVDDNYLDNLLNPSVIFEVISRTTELYDRGEKFARCGGIVSLKTYILISQDKARVEVFDRLPDDSWRITTCASLDDIVQLTSVDCALPLADVYDKVEFGGVRESARPGDISLQP